MKRSQPINMQQGTCGIPVLGLLALRNILHIPQEGISPRDLQTVHNVSFVSFTKVTHS